jgi:SAM-dependent methyltransferase
LLLRVLAAASSATAVGIDHDEALLERGRANATRRQLDDRVIFRAGLPEAHEDLADVVICVGADHIFGSQNDALRSLYELVAPGGRLLLGTGFWEQPPTSEQAAAIGAKPGDYSALGDLVDVALAQGFRLLDLRTATRREWEHFEFGYLADWEEWLMNWPADAGAADVASRSAEHRVGYLRGWRDIMGFGYLVLGRRNGER